MASISSNTFRQSPFGATFTTNAHGLSVEAMQKFVEKYSSSNNAFNNYRVQVDLSENNLMEVLDAALRGTRELSKISILKFYASVLDLVEDKARILGKEGDKYKDALEKVRECKQLATFEIEVAENPDSFCWKKKDGTKIRLIDMEDSYLLNAINYLYNKAVDDVLLKSKYKTIEEALGGRIYRWLNLEAKRRGIVDKKVKSDDNIDIDLQE